MAANELLKGSFFATVRRANWAFVVFRLLVLEPQNAHTEPVAQSAGLARKKQYCTLQTYVVSAAVLVVSSSECQHVVFQAGGIHCQWN